MCGIWYLSTKNASLKYNQILKSAIQIDNRGQNGWGTLVSYSGNYVRYMESNEPLSFPRHDDITERFYNNRYPTVGGKQTDNYPPQIFVGRENVNKENICGNDLLFTFLNGEFKVDSERRELLDLGFILKATSDTVVVAGHVQKQILDGDDLMNASIKTLEQISGAYAIMFHRSGETVIARDAFGTRPLYLYINDDGSVICAASESQCFKSFDHFYHEQFMKDYPYSSGWRPFIPGETIRIKNNEIIESHLIKIEDLKWRN